MGGGDHLPPARGIQHSRGLVQNDAVRLHGDDPRDGDALLLSAGEKMRRMLGKVRHAHRAQSLVHPAADFCRGDAQIFRREGHVLLHHVGHNLIVWILEHHPNPAADVQQPILVGGVHPLHQHPARGGQKNGVKGLCQRRFPGAVVPQNHHKGALFNVQVHAPQGPHRLLPLFHGGIEVLKPLRLKNRRHVFTSNPYSLHQRPVAPQGRYRPVLVTGRPSSSHAHLPPYFSFTRIPNKYPSTDGASPVV
ncbi:hypothetical protein SDC9_165037 [bioreactor metagenome]|uniref:Uncharacterized protein n=1 Tax=bioreactor metagenome TaxID=1076179 RepID=A0A645FVK8_9ZZZZ